MRTGCHEHCARHQLCDSRRRWIPVEPGFRGPRGQERSRGAATVHYADATRAGYTVTQQGVRGRDQHTEQVVAELHQEEVHGQGFVKG